VITFFKFRKLKVKI